MLSVTTTTFHTWLEHYEESYPTDYSELYATNANDIAVHGMARGETEDPNQVIDKLIEFPFFGTFVCSVEEGKTTLSVHVLHHFFKNSPHGIPYVAGNEDVYAWKGVGPDAIIVEFKASALETDDQHKKRTPTLRDFIQAAGDPNQVESLEAADSQMFTTEVMKNKQLDNGDPLPFKHLRRCGGIIPPFLVPCFKGECPRVALHLCLAEARIRVEDDFGGDSEDDGLNFWKACYPILQRLWLMSREFAPPEPEITLEFLKLANNEATKTPIEWAIKTGADMVRRYLAADDVSHMITQETDVPMMTNDPYVHQEQRDANIRAAASGRIPGIPIGPTYYHQQQQAPGTQQQSPNLYQQQQAAYPQMAGQSQPNQQGPAPNQQQQQLYQQTPATGQSAPILQPAPAGYYPPSAFAFPNQPTNWGGVPPQFLGGTNQAAHPNPYFFYPPPPQQQTAVTPDPTSQALFATLTDISAKTNALLTDKESGSGNEKHKWTTRFPVQKQSFIRFASASTEKVVPDGPAEEYLTLLETKKEHSLSMVQHGITTQRGGSQVIDNAFASALYTGTLHNTEGNGSPKGLSLFFAVPANLSTERHQWEKPS